MKAMTSEGQNWEHPAGRGSIISIRLFPLLFEESQETSFRHKVYKVGPLAAATAGHVTYRRQKITNVAQEQRDEAGSHAD